MDPEVDASTRRRVKATPGGDISFGFVSGPAGQALVCAALADHAAHLITTRQLQLRHESMAEDYHRIAHALGVGRGADTEEPEVVRVKQVHGRAVLFVRPGEPVPPLPEADAIVCSDPERVISVRVADCVPVLLADRAHRVVAAVHAGWRGAAAGVIGAAVRMTAAAAVDPADLVAAIGPAIGPCCYQVDEPVCSRFTQQMPGSAAWFAPDGTRWRLDLWAAAHDQLVAAGIPRDAIHVARRCTAHEPEHWFSFRRDGAGTGRMVAAIRLQRR
jgi:YfiH family protein